MNKNLEKSKEVKFYELCHNTIIQMANERTITNLNDYFTPTDFHIDNNSTMFFYLESTHEEFRNDWKRRVFAQFIFHAQNETGAHLRDIVKFADNIEIIYDVLNGFDVHNANYTVETLVDIFRNYMTWKENKNKPDYAMKRWCESIVKSAEYIKKFETKEDLVNHLATEVWGNDRRFSLTKINNRFKEKCVSIGFGTALMCDLLKELDEQFSHVLKPDIHIKDVVTALSGQVYRDDNKCYIEFIRILDVIKLEYPDVTAYKLDKIIWLICSGDFYLHKSVNKSTFIRNILEL